MIWTWLRALPAGEQILVGSLVLGIGTATLISVRDTKPVPYDICERAVHHRARATGYQCCIETCGARGVAGFITTEQTHACVCGGSRP